MPRTFLQNKNGHSTLGGNDRLSMNTGLEKWLDEKVGYFEDKSNR